jgi:hypothetical protein
MRLAVVVIVLLAACGSGGSSGPRVEPGQPAGDVVDVAGDVTARRDGGEPRRLSVGDEVSGDDVVATADGASIVIELRHNGVRWSLGGGQSRQVARSEAWAARRKTEAAGPGERTTAAGRQGEREGAETGVGAVTRSAIGGGSPEGVGDDGAALDVADRDLEATPYTFDAAPASTVQGDLLRLADFETCASHPAPAGTRFTVTVVVEGGRVTRADTDAAGVAAELGRCVVALVAQAVPAGDAHTIAGTFVVND